MAIRSGYGRFSGQIILTTRVPLTLSHVRPTLPWLKRRNYGFSTYRSIHYSFNLLFFGLNDGQATPRQVRSCTQQNIKLVVKLSTLFAIAVSSAQQQGHGTLSANVPRKFDPN
jgi:hypothetical protein